jgi:transposase
MNSADKRLNRCDPDDLAREFVPTAQSIRHWVGMADRRDGRREDKVEAARSTERDALVRLRRENKQRRQQRDIRSSAAAWFARARAAKRSEGTVPSGSSNS